MTTFSDKETLSLIELVKDNPLLYSIQHPKYRDDRERDFVWKSISEVLNKSDAECRKKWKLLKDSCNRFKRKQVYSGRLGPPKNSKWRLFERLRFLDDINIFEDEDDEVEEEQPMFQSASSPQNQPKITVGVPETSTPSVAKTVSVSQKIAAEPSSSKKEQNIQKRKRSEDEFLDLLQERQTNRHVVVLPEPTAPQELDEITSFAHYIEVSLRKLSSRSKSLAKSEIFSVITKYEMVDMNAADPFSSISVANTSSYLTKMEPDSSPETLS